MNIVLISDTHGLHNAMDIPEGDLLIHAGDLSSRGLPHEVQAFMTWFGKLPHPHKVMIAGNHDFLAEKDPALFESMVPEGVTYLNDSGVEIEGIKIWGSPIQPWFHDWAFNRIRGPQIRTHWQLIPPDTDLLITHGPPFGILDKVENGPNVGCEDLLAVVEQINPKLHVFGHIHEARGIVEKSKTIFVNASMVNLRYQPVHAAQVLDWEFDVMLGR
jgi:Icc-related predicted phosphoesterase